MSGASAARGGPWPGHGARAYNREGLMAEGQWTRKNRKLDDGVLRLQLGKGVLSKDEITPFAAGTMHYTTRDGWKHPARLSWKNLALLLAEPSVSEIEIIDEENNRVQINLRKTQSLPD